MDKKELNFIEHWQKYYVNPSTPLFRKKRMILLFASFVSILALIGGLPIIHKNYLQAQLVQVEAQIEELANTERLLQEKESLIQEVQFLSLIITRIDNNDNNPEAVLNKIRVYLPSDIVIDQFEFSGDNQLKLTMSIPRPLDVAKLWSSLQGSGIVEDFDIQTVSLVNEVQVLTLHLKLVATR